MTWKLWDQGKLFRDRSADCPVPYSTVNTLGVRLAVRYTSLYHPPHEIIVCRDFEFAPTSTRLSQAGRGRDVVLEKSWM